MTEGQDMPQDMGASSGSREPGLASRPGPPGFDPERGWTYTRGSKPVLLLHTVIEALGRLGDVYGPLPFEMFSDEAWEGNMLGYSHDLLAYRIVEADWRETFRYEPRAVEGWRTSPAIATETRRAETTSGSVEDEGAGLKGIAHD